MKEILRNNWHFRTKSRGFARKIDLYGENVAAFDSSVQICHAFVTFFGACILSVRDTFTEAQFAQNLVIR